jgi:hypothetical protein
VLRVCVLGKIAFVVCRPIAKGSQLFDCYKWEMKKPGTEQKF